MQPSTPLVLCMGRGYSTRIQNRVAYSCHDIIYSHGPTRQRRLCFRHISATVNRGILGIIGTVYTNYLIVQDIHIPHYEGACREVIGALGGHCALRQPCRAIIAVAAYFNREYGRAIEELPSL